MSRPRIVVIGSSNTDLVVRAPRIPTPGETVLGGSYMTAGGGKGANQAVAAARLGAEVTLVARIGADAFGDAALDGFAREGISTRFVMRDVKSHSGVALIVVDDHGENAITVAPGANARLTEADVDRALECIADADALVLQLETPLSAVHRAATIARAAGVPTILNPAPAQPVSRHLLRAVSVLTPNQSEAEHLTGIPVPDAPAARVATDMLRTEGVPAVVVTLGASGAFCADAEGTEHVPALPVTAVDTTAAGDAFTGALAVALAQAEPLVEAVRFATAVAALTVMRPGAQPSLPTLSQVDELRAKT